MVIPTLSAGQSAAILDMTEALVKDGLEKELDMKESLD